MLRGSSFLLERSVKFYEHLIETIVRLDKRLWEIDVDSYSDEHLDLLLSAKESICESLGKHYRPSDTLVTKIMLGIYGNVPAFDNFFRRGFGVGAMNKKHLKRVREFYDHHKPLIDNFEIFTLDFYSGEATKRHYTKAKIVDMVGFMEGWE